MSLVSFVCSHVVFMYVYWVCLFIFCYIFFYPLYSKPWLCKWRVNANVSYHNYPDWNDYMFISFSGRQQLVCNLNSIVFLYTWVHNTYIRMYANRCNWVLQLWFWAWTVACPSWIPFVVDTVTSFIYES